MIKVYICLHSLGLSRRLSTQKSQLQYLCKIRFKKDNRGRIALFKATEDLLGRKGDENNP